MQRQTPFDEARLQAALDAAGRETEAELAGVPRTDGFCHLLWQAKKFILRDKYGIAWQTPAEINPHVQYD